MDANEAIGLKFLGHRGNGFAEEIGIRVALQEDVISFRLDRKDVLWIEEKDFPLGFDGDPYGLCRRWFGARTEFRNFCGRCPCERVNGL